MPVASGEGKWPHVYRLKEQPPINRQSLSKKCHICVQKKCFSCEHSTRNRDEILKTNEDEPERTKVVLIKEANKTQNDQSVDIIDGTEQQQHSLKPEKFCVIL